MKRFLPTDLDRVLHSIEWTGPLTVGGAVLDIGAPCAEGTASGLVVAAILGKAMERARSTRQVWARNIACTALGGLSGAVVAGVDALRTNTAVTPSAICGFGFGASTGLAYARYTPEEPAPRPEVVIEAPTEIEILAETARPVIPRQRTGSTTPGPNHAINSATFITSTPQSVGYNQRQYT